jgi:transcriptional regulator with XRE-family HTH domain
MRTDRSTVRSRHLGAVLAQVIRDKGVLAQDIAARLDWSPPQISRLVRGRCRVSPVDVATILGMCDVYAGPARAVLLDLAADADSPTWLQEHGDGPAAEPAAVRELEDAATHIVCVDGGGVPALLQAGAYLTAAHRANPLIPDAEIGRRTRVLLDRQGVLDRANLVEAYLGAQALSRNGFGDAVLSDQVHHLLRLSVRPNIRLRVVPEPVGCPPFQLLDFAEAAPVVHVADLNSTLLTQRPATVAGYRRLVEWLEESALSTEASRRYLNQVADVLGDRLDQYL